MKQSKVLMKGNIKGLFLLSILSIGCLIFNMLMTYIHRNEVFVKQDSVSILEFIMIIGFIIILVYCVLVFLWLLWQIRGETSKPFYIFTLFLCGICILLMMGQKVLYDEIAREYRLGWEVLGEGIILYIFFCVQVTFNLIMLRHFCRLPISR
jgi:hypothetical protein